MKHVWSTAWHLGTKRATEAESIVCMWEMSLGFLFFNSMDITCRDHENGCLFTTISSPWENLGSVLVSLFMNSPSMEAGACLLSHRLDTGTRLRSATLINLGHEMIWMILRMWLKAPVLLSAILNVIFTCTQTVWWHFKTLRHDISHNVGFTCTFCKCIAYFYSKK